jgi:hypothetical protein
MKVEVRVGAGARVFNWRGRGRVKIAKASALLVAIIDVIVVENQVPTDIAGVSMGAIEEGAN